MDPDVGMAGPVANVWTEDRCRVLLERLRWPRGTRCPRCDASTGISRIETRGQYECGSCAYQFSVRVGTALHGSRLPLWKWFVAVSLMTESEGISANQLGQILGISYKTAWFLCHRIRAAMKDQAAEIVGLESHGDGVDQQRIALLRRSATDIHRKLSPKHLPAYLDEVAFRLNNRESDHRFQDTLVRLLNVEALPYAELTARH